MIDPGKRKTVTTGSPYEPILGFSRAVRVGPHVSVSGTAPIGPDGETMAPGDPAAQARRCFNIAKAALEELGASLSDVIRTRMYLTRADDWKTIGGVHGEFFANVRPASTVVEVSRLIDPDWLVEIEVDAVIAEP